MNWTELPLRKYVEITDIYTNTGISDEDRLLYVIQVIFDVNPLKLTMPELQKYIKEIDFLKQPIPKVRIRNTYILGNTKYILQKDLKDISVAQWVDYQSYMKDGSGVDNFHNILSVLFFPEGCEEYGEGFDLLKVKEDISNHLSVADAMAISTFFLHYRTKLSVLSLLYIRKKMLKGITDRTMRRRIRRTIRRAMVDLIGG